MKRKTIILLIIFIGYIALCNYGIYSYRIKGEYWELQDLIIFLGILNGVIITLPLGAYLSYQLHKEDKERKEITLLLVKNMIDRHQEEKKELQDKINELEDQLKKKTKKRVKNKCIADN